MNSILTITLNSAFDKNTTVPVLIPEKKLKYKEQVYEPDRGAIIESMALKKLGGEATVIYLASVHTGKAFTQLLIDEAVEFVLTEIKENTMENLVVLDAASKVVKKVY
jgi:6-phosphofructokinase 2